MKRIVFVRYVAEVEASAMAVEQLAESGRLSPPISAPVLSESEDDWG